MWHKTVFQKPFVQSTKSHNGVAKKVQRKTSFSFKTVNWFCGVKKNWKIRFTNDFRQALRISPSCNILSDQTPWIENLCVRNSTSLCSHKGFHSSLSWMLTVVEDRHMGLRLMEPHTPSNMTKVNNSNLVCPFTRDFKLESNVLCFCKFSYRNSFF